MDKSIFMDLTKMPVSSDLEIPLGNTYSFWKEICDFVFEKYPAAIEEWHVSVKKYGWGYRIKDKKRAIIYLLPRQGYFKTGFVFGPKAADEIRNSRVSADIRDELENARMYAEGKGIRIDIRTEADINDIKKLVEIKLRY